ncbi:MAG TPA: RNA polymerase sigma factor [Armatimonadota bacterium]|jgi:RNA polymerase sigma-70 factor (ECF subfamily)
MPGTPTPPDTKKTRETVADILQTISTDREEAEDVAQRVLVKAWDRLGELQEPLAFAEWLRTMTVRACLAWYRRRATAPSCCPWDEQQAYGTTLVTSLSALLRREAQRGLLQALHALPLENCLPLLLHVCGGYRYEDIAQLLGLPLTTVEGRIYRARQQLRRLMEGEAFELFDWRL